MSNYNIINIGFVSFYLAGLDSGDVEDVINCGSSVPVIYRPTCLLIIKTAYHQQSDPAAGALVELEVAYFKELQELAWAA